MEQKKEVNKSLDDVKVTIGGREIKGITGMSYESSNEKINYKSVSKMKNLSEAEIERRKKVNSKILKVLLPIIGIFVILMMVLTCSESEKPKTKAEIEQQKKDSIFEARTKKIDLALMGFEKMVKDKMRDPDSYENIAKTYDKKDTANVVKMLLKFRGNNGFGGKTITTVLADYNFKEDYLEITNQFNE